MKRRFFNTCVAWPPEYMPALNFLISNSDEITREEFLADVEPRQMRAWENRLGYGAGGLTMEEDYHVKYFRNQLTTIPFFVHSAIEHVFAGELEIKALTRYANAVENTTALILDRPARFNGLEARDPEEFSDRYDEIFDAAFGHFGPIVHIEDGSLRSLSQSDQKSLDQILSIAEFSYNAVRIWVGDGEPPAGYETVEPDAIMEHIALKLPQMAVSYPEGEVPEARADAPAP